MDRPAPISVCIHCLTFNHEQWIERALQGFVMQKTNFPFVAVVIDDCSSDRTAVILREYEKRYPSIIKAICLQENYHSQNKSKLGLFKPFDVDAKYIAFCEGDDYWTDPNKLQLQVDYLENHPDIGLCYTDYSRADKDLRITTPSCFSGGMKRPESFEDHLLSRCYIAPMTWVFRKDTKQQITIPHGFVDGTFAIALEFFQNSKIGFLDTDTAVHVVHPDSACHQTDPQKKFRYEYRLFKEQLFFAEKYSGEAMVIRLQFDKYLSLLPQAIRVNNQEFIRDAEQFFTSKGAYFEDIYNHAIKINADKQEIKKARSSKSYRLGSALLKPFRKLIKNG